MSSGNLILILGDQLSTAVSSLAGADRGRDRVLMAELHEETTYVRHHKKKIALVLSAMRHFAAVLEEEGWHIEYIRLDDPENTKSFTGEIERALDRQPVERIVVTEPGEWRLLEQFRQWSQRFGVPVDILTDDRFLCSRSDFAEWASGRKQLRMEYFYRDMRRRTGLLMDGDNPIGGKWNFDAENRKPAKPDLFMPRPLHFEPDRTTADVLGLVGERFGGHFGDLEPFWFATKAQQAKAALDQFIEHALPSFGDYQDAMLRGERFIYHSVLSAYINIGLLDPLSVCRAVEEAYASGAVPINAAEGFIRQIIGWREYVRGIYWLKMPDYVEENVFSNTRPLPDFYWTAETDMTCLREAITQTKEDAYAHHIQRLMLTGNFALLAGVAPREIHEWYLAVYADAYEWVELPNTLGMSQFADGGLLGSKPYAASGNYINKMSDYCRDCRYDVRLKTGPDACPFNALYWDFLVRNRGTLGANPRLGQVYRTWDKMDPAKQTSYRESAHVFLTTLT
ncbi:cryptochrome/photolyase family protein [Hoeflea prorocentri]|uniref:Cryptochrome/photolyase family protein n=1 Tax=Hoeflea prorocentri TaxID=1922333 RepID=A0A9X3UHP9_9HYPH|nr:cryptochrome/photolyase family protein [Hoeflea prorocentri]MCY6381542.1 cryptochrome/photolyase family protein [Hoeflea prorocentri]MDA5399342.1 cryptochrome/photolyase family protein [Hoeflea prorocentri]